MRVAVWDYLPEQLFAGTPRGVQGKVEFVRVPALQAREVLERGEVDAALLPTLTVLQDSDAFDVFPAVALSSWEFPFARLFLSGGFEARPTILHHDGDRQLEALVARVVLREQYGSEVKSNPLPAAAVMESLRAEGGAALLVSGDAYRTESEALGMDLGREWFELVNYPMVWGVFATTKGAVTDESIQSLRDAVARVDLLREKRAEAVDDDVAADFLRDQVRLRLDDLAVASLTELYNYVYYYGAVTDYATVPFVELKESAEEEDSDSSS